MKGFNYFDCSYEELKEMGAARIILSYSDSRLGDDQEEFLNSLRPSSNDYNTIIIDVVKNAIVDRQGKIIKVSGTALNCKVSDALSVCVLNKNGRTIYEDDGYVPNFIPGEEFGDYFGFVLKNGIIKNI